MSDYKRFFLSVLIYFLQSECFLNSQIEVEDSVVSQYDPFGIKPLSTGMKPIQGSCLAFKENLATLAQNVTHCFVYNSRPFRVCSGCLSQKTEFDSVYENLTIKDEGGNTCEKTLCYKDRIQIILKTKQYVDDVWHESNCNNCFLNDTLSPDVETFLSKLNDTVSCFMNFTTTKLDGFEELELSWKNASFNSSACESCRDLYEDVNKFFYSMERKFKSEVCMDVVDRINVTRRLWSQSFNCYHFQPAWWWACWPIVTSLFSTILFYTLAVLFCKSKQTTAVYRQKRLRPSGLAGSSVTLVDFVVVDEEA